MRKGIRRRGMTYLIDVTWKGTRRTATARTLVEAEAKRVELSNGLMNNPAAVADKVSWTLAEALKRATSIAWAGARSELTSVRNACGALAYFGGARRLATISTTALDGYVEALQARGNSDGTINRKLAALSKMMAVAIERGGLSSKPHFPRRRESQGRIRFLTDAEERRVITLFRQWNCMGYADAVMVLADTGLRLGELLRLEHRDVDLKARLLTVWQTKTGQPRTVPMTTRVHDILISVGQGRCFLINEDAFRHAWDRARGLMGLTDDKGFVIHALRHTCASRLVQRGVNLKVIQEWLGHKSLAMTMRYAHLSPTNLLDAVAVLEQTAPPPMGWGCAAAPSGKCNSLRCDFGSACVLEQTSKSPAPDVAAVLP